MDRKTLVRHLAQAERHVAAGQHHLERQRRVVAKRQREGFDDREAMDLLMEFERLQAIHVADRNRLRLELGF
jgi:hypothetical protein